MVIVRGRGGAGAGWVTGSNSNSIYSREEEQGASGVTSFFCPWDPNSNIVHGTQFFLN